MYVNDPVADMITRIRNANTVYHEIVEMPVSRLRVNIAKILKEEGYIKNFKVINAPKKPYQILRIFMRYGAGKEKIIQDLQRASKPGRRVYSKAKDLPKVMGGLGIAVVSTSKGLCTDEEARARNLGGEVMCYIW
ncbi:MAG: 30S ribosomal protein S8 [Synergistales bacterium]|nr:30S ribosomal protein S8 [Synergistales bacterium]